MSSPRLRRRLLDPERRFLVDTNRCRSQGKRVGNPPPLGPAQPVAGVYVWYMANVLRTSRGSADGRREERR